MRGCLVSTGACGILLGAAMALSLPVDAASFSLAPDQVLAGAPGIYVTRQEDTLLDIARRYDLGYGQLAVVNQGFEPWLPGDGRHIALPSLYLAPDGPRRGIVINLAERRLYYFPPDGQTIETYPIGVGVEGLSTPLGETEVVSKEIHPTWYPPASIREEKPELPEVVPPGPDNPLGDYALKLGWPAYLIHGTNKPYGVGRNVSHGCIRLYPEDIARLFAEVPVGTPVRVVDEEARVAWVGGELYLAAYPSKEQVDELSVNQPMTPAIPANLQDLVASAAGPEIARIDWNVVGRIGVERSGVPIRITKPVSAPSS